MRHAHLTDQTFLDVAQHAAQTATLLRQPGAHIAIHPQLTLDTDTEFDLLGVQ